MGNGVEQHFRKEELSFLKQVEEWVEEVRLQYAPVLTNYLDPRQQFIVEAIVGQYDDVRYYFDGGYIDAERKRCMICPNIMSQHQRISKMLYFIFNIRRNLRHLGMERF